MNGMEKIQAKLAEDAKAELGAIEAESQKEVEAIKKQGQQDAERLTQDLLDRGEKQAAERKERLMSSAQMECRKMELAVKQEVISEAFDKALEELCNLPEKEYQEILVSLVLGSLNSGAETLIFSEKDQAVGKQVVAKVNEAIAAGKAPSMPASITASKAGPFLEKILKEVNGLVNKGDVKLSSETRAMPAGFIMLDGDVEINCDFDTLVRLQRNELELEVSGILF